MHFRVAQVHGDYLGQRSRSVQVQVLLTALQMHSGQEAYQAEIMVTVQVTDKYIVYPAGLGAVFFQLHLRTLAAVYQYKLIFYLQQLGRLMPVMCRSGTVRPQYFQFKSQNTDPALTGL
jgi:hypothetical protein